MGDGMADWSWIWPALMLAGLVLLGYAAYGLRQDRTGPGSAAASPTARRILDERYARGEIDDEEYLRRRAELP